MSDYYLFHANHTCKLLHISRSTLDRWKREGLIEFRKAVNGIHNLFALDEINRIRTGRGLIKLTHKEAEAFWETH